MTSIGRGSILKEAEKALSNGLYKEAEDLFSRAIDADPSNPKSFEGRSCARIQLQSYEDAFHDAERAVDLDPDFIMGYFQLGVSLQCLGEYPQSIVAFSEGIKRDQKNPQFINAIIEVSLLSDIKTSLEPVMSQLRKMRLDANPFVISSVIGQELLSHDYVEDAVQVLENAVSIGTKSLKLKGSVFSALSSALWSLGDTERAVYYMQEDLTVSRLLSDNAGECRAHGNLGVAYYSQGNYQLAKENHNRQLALAQTTQDVKSVASAFSSLGHVSTAVGDHQGAAESHKQSAAIFRNKKDTTGWCRQLNLVASAYLSLNDLDSALQWQLECLRVTTDEFSSLDGAKEEAKARVDLAAIYHKMHKYTEEISCLQKAAGISRNLEDADTESQILSSLGYITRFTGDLEKAQASFERLLEISLTDSDRSMEAKACANLGVIHHQIGDFEMALKLQARSLELSLEFRDLGSQGRAHGNIGNVYSAMGMYEQAIQHHMKELEISGITGDKASECSTHGNLAIAYQALGDAEKAFHHFSCQTSLASQIGDTSNESRGYMNLGNFHSSRKEYRPAVQVYLKHLELVENAGSGKPYGIAKVCYNIGFAFFSLQEYENAITFYEKSLKISLDIGDTVSVARAYCNLGLAWKAYGDLDKALNCQNVFLTLSTKLQSVRGIFKALGNIGDIYISKTQPENALALYEQQYELAKSNQEQTLKAQAAGALGVANRLIGDYQKAIEFHTEELQIYQTSKDEKNEFRAHGHLGAVLTSLEEYSGAAKCYENQCYVAQKLDDTNLESIALGNMGITLINLQDYERAIDFFERQLLIVEKIPGQVIERGKVVCNIGECYEALQNYDEAISLFEEALECAIESKHQISLERVYRGLSSAYKLSNKPKEAFKFCKLRIEACHEMHNLELLSEAYGELGYLFTIMADFGNALSCLKIQMKYAKDFPHLCGDAACGLGSIYQILREYDEAIKHHLIDLEIATESNNVPCQGRAHGNLGTAYEYLHNHEMAIKHQEQHLFIADTMKDPLAKLTALRGIGRNILRQGKNNQRAVAILQQALLLSREQGVKEDEGRIILDIGLVNLVCNDSKNAEDHLKEAEMILTQEFWKSCNTGDKMNIFIHPNLCIELFEELLTCQFALSCLYINTNQPSKAIEIAERLRKLPETIASKILGKNQPQSSDDAQNLTEELAKYSADKDCVILYYSIQAGTIYTWVITPENGLCGFSHRSLLSTEEIDIQDNVDHEGKKTRNLLCQFISDLHDSLGLASPSEPPSGENDTLESDVDDASTADKIPEFHPESNPAFKTFHRLVTSQTLMSCSRNISILGVLDHNDAVPSKKTAIYSLFDLLISKIYDKIEKYASKQPLKKMILVAEGDLLSVPFPLLKRRPTELYLSQQFILQVVPSATNLFKHGVQRSCDLGQITRGVVIGNPEVDDISCAPLSQASEDEANLVGTLLKVEPITGRNATKEALTRDIKKAECLHIACRFCENYPYHIVLSSSGDRTRKSSNLEHNPSDASNSDSGIVKDTNVGGDDFCDLEKKEGMTLSLEEVAQRSFPIGELLNFDLSHTKVAVLGSAYLQESRFPNGGVEDDRPNLWNIFIIRSFLFSQVQTLLRPLWPVPETACKLLTQSFYNRLIDGLSTTEALNQSMNILRNSEQFEHPSYWAGFTLVGHDVTLDLRNLTLFYALKLLIESKEQKFHDALRLALHLIDKSLERMESGADTSVPMYASQVSIGKKVGNVQGWRELFSAVGFELRSSGSGIPDAVFFPRAEMKDDLLKAKSELISYVQLPPLAVTGLNQLLPSPAVGYHLKESISSCLEEHIGSDDKSGSIQQMALFIHHKIWRAVGCSDILSSLGFKVSQIGEENVMLHSTPDHHDNIETMLGLLNMFFGNPQSALDVQSDENEETQRIRSTSEVSSRPSFSNAMIRGLPPSTRRSIAVDFNATMKSRGSLESLLHLELPDHMTDETEREKGEGSNAMNRADTTDKKMDTPRNFTSAPSGGDILAPRAMLPPAQKQLQANSNVEVQYAQSHALAEKLRVLKEDGSAASHSIQRSKRFQFHGSGSPNSNFNSLERRISRSPQKSPMFYRKSDDENIESSSNQTAAKSSSGVTQALLQSSLKSVVSGQSHSKSRDPSPTRKQPIRPQTPPRPTTTNTHFVPIKSPDDISFSSGNVIYPTPKWPEGRPQTDRSKLGGERSPGSPYIPAPSVASGIFTKSLDYNNIVDKLARISTSDLSDSGQGQTNHFQGREADYHYLGPVPPLSLDGLHDHVKVLSYLQPDLPRISMATDLVQRSPQGGHKGFVSGQSYSKDQSTGVHIYSRSLDDGIGSREATSSSHKHSSSHAGVMVPLKQSETFISPKKVSHSSMHSRTSSHTSQGSGGSHKPGKITNVKKPLHKYNSNQSLTGSDSSQVSYQLETSNHGKTWFINENESLVSNQLPSSSKSVTGNEVFSKSSGLVIRGHQSPYRQKRKVEITNQSGKFHQASILGNHSQRRSPSSQVNQTISDVKQQYMDGGITNKRGTIYHPGTDVTDAKDVTGHLLPGSGRDKLASFIGQNTGNQELRNPITSDQPMTNHLFQPIPTNSQTNLQPSVLKPGILPRYQSFPTNAPVPNRFGYRAMQYRPVRPPMPFNQSKNNSEQIGGTKTNLDKKDEIAFV